MTPRVVSSAADRAVGVAPDAGDLAVLQDVDAESIGGAGVSPGDRIVPRGSAAPLQGRSEHRVADVADIQRRTEFLGLLGGQPFVVDAIGAVGVDVPLGRLLVMNRVREHHDAARGEHDVVVELLRQGLPHLQRVVVQRGAFVEQVVRADDGGVAAGVAAADPAFFHHRDVA